MWPWLLIAALGAVAFLGWNLLGRLGVDRLDAFNKKRRSTSRLVSQGEFVDGNRHMKVALALTGDELIYENTDVQASLDLKWVREVEYDSSLATGAAIDRGTVLRLRCASQAFEFVLSFEDVPRWHLMLPPRGDTRSETGIPALGETAIPLVAAS